MRGATAPGLDKIRVRAPAALLALALGGVLEVARKD